MLRMISSLFTLLSAITMITAQTTLSITTPGSSSSVTATTSSTAPAKTWTVSVGKADHVFRPDILQASIGDTVEFQFAPANHSVVRAEYMYPCIPYELTGRGKAGFFSGFHPVDAILDDPPKWSLRINDTDPIFYYCSAPGSCVDYRMVGVINPNASTSLQLQKKLAGESKYMLQPGDSFPAEGGLVAGSGTGSNASIPSTSATTSGPNSLAAGAIAGIVVGAIALLVIAAGTIYLAQRRKSAKKVQLREQKQRNAANAAAHPMAQAGHLNQTLPIAAPTAADPFNGGGTVYIPIKASEFAEYNRHSGSDAPEVAVSPADSNRNLISPLQNQRPEERQVWPPARPESPTMRHELPAQSRFDGL